MWKRISSLKIERKKRISKENVESHETISLYVINDASSNRWDPIINSAICFAVYWIPFHCFPFHPLLGFISNVHQAGVDLALTFSLLSLISPLQTSDFNDFLLFLATVNGIGFSFLLRLGTSFAFFTGSDCESRACDKSSRWCYQTEWILISEQMTRVVIRILMNSGTINPWLCGLGVRDWEVIVNERRTTLASRLKIMTIRDVKITTKVGWLGSEQNEILIQWNVAEFR